MNRGGRPPAPIDYFQLAQLRADGASLRKIGELLHISRQTALRALKTLSQNPVDARSGAGACPTTPQFSNVHQGAKNVKKNGTQPDQVRIEEIRRKQSIMEKLMDDYPEYWATMTREQHEDITFLLEANDALRRELEAERIVFARLGQGVKDVLSLAEKAAAPNGEGG
jgi:hypothetical protein